MLELSMTLPIKVQMRDYLFPGGRHPARRLESWGNYLCRKRSINDSGRRTDISGRCGESLLLWPNRQHVGGGGIFPPISNFTGCILRLKRRTTTLAGLSSLHLSVPQQTKVVDPQALVALVSPVLKRTGKASTHPALEFIVLLILQQLTRDARLDEQADGAGTTLAWKAQKLIRTQYHRPLSTALLARELYCNADYLEARLPAGVSSDVNRSNPSPAGARSRKAVN